MAEAWYQLDDLRIHLRPFRLHWYPTLGSTNDHAARLRREGQLIAPAVVLTGRQTRGRGRGTNPWHAPAGVMTATFVLPHAGIAAGHLPLIAGLAVQDAVADLGVDAGLKWPNDLWCDGLKLAGLLCERLAGVDLVGVGLNLNVDVADLPTSLRATATSVRAVTGRTTPPNQAVIAVATHLRSRLIEREQAVSAMLRRYDALHVLSGLRVRVKSPGEQVIEGSCAGIDSQGRLLVDASDGRHAIVSGHVRPI